VVILVPAPPPKRLRSLQAMRRNRIGVHYMTHTGRWISPIGGM
jgi:hypothetical protein